MQISARTFDKSPALSAAGKFGNFKPESGRDVRKMNVKANPVIEEMKKAWELHEILTENGGVFDKVTYDRIFKGIKHRYSAKDVEDFSILMSELQGGAFFPTSAGFFLSGLINNCNDAEFIIHTKAFAEPIISIGYRNTKNITIDGDAGAYLGDEMVKGTIIVKGNAGDSVGWYMKGGSIIVEGDAGYSVGCHMSDGELRINGSFKEISQEFPGGKVFHKGRLIVDK
jgi:hypothetical protein